MSTSVTFNGTSYTVPAIADASWGTNVGTYLIAIASGCLQKTGGTFTLSTADVNFGATYGLKSVYLKSVTTNIASAGVVQLAKTDVMSWRNNANGADLSLAINGSDALLFNSIAVADASSSMTFTNKLFSDSTCKFANVSDATKLLLFSLGGATTGKTMTFISSHTNNRSITFPDATDTLVALATTDTMSNKTFVAPVLGAATATSINKMAITAPGTSSTLAVADGKTFTVSNTLTFTGTDTNSFAFPSGSSTVMTLASADTITGVKSFNDGKLALNGSSSGSMTVKAPAAASTYVATFFAGTDTVVGLTFQQTMTNKLFSDSTCKFANVSDATKLCLFSLGGATTGKALTLISSHTNDRSLTFPDTTDTLVGKATTDTLTNKTLTGNTAVNLISGSGTVTLNTTGTVTLPGATDTLMGKATTDTMTNKTATAMDVSGGSYINLLTQAAIRFNDDAGGEYVALKAPTGVTTHTLLLPASQGAASTTINNDGSGNLTWVAGVSAGLNQYNSDIGNSSNTRTATNTNLIGDIVASTSSATITMTSATPAVITHTGHGASSGDKVYFTTTGGFYTGVSASTTYWITKIDANSYKISSSLSNYFLATFVNTSGSQSGTHTGYLGGLVYTKVQTANITGADSGVTLVLTDARTQVVVPTANRTYTLPTTGVLAGDQWTIVNNSTVSSSDLQIAVNSSGANLVRTIWSQTSASFVSLVNTPTTAAHWMCITPAISNWTAFTPTGAWSTNTTYTGYYRRVGENMQLNVLVTCSGAPTSATLSINIPLSKSINTSAIIALNSNRFRLGFADILDSGVANYNGQVMFYETNPTTSVLLASVNASGTFAVPTLVTQASPITFGNADAVQCKFEVPITGWTATGG